MTTKNETATKMGENTQQQQQMDFSQQSAQQPQAQVVEPQPKPQPKVEAKPQPQPKVEAKQQPAVQPQQQAKLQVTDKDIVTYEVAGQEVKLSYSIVRKYLTKGNADVTDQELVQFISVCKFNKLNPFLNEAYLIKFKSARGDGNAQMIVSKEALFKRAEACEQYDGIEAGIIVLRGDNVVELEGCFRQAKDVLLGGWAKVYRKDRRVPTVSKVNMSEYDKGNSIWNEKKATMISKIAKVQALREAFPSQLGAMYAKEETSALEQQAKQVKDVDCEEVDANAGADGVRAIVDQAMRK